MMATPEISTSRTFHSMKSISSTATKIRLPIEEAVKAEFPPQCKVLCFDDDGGFRVGVVKHVMVSISLPSQHVFGTFYEVEMNPSAGRDAKVRGVFGQTDLRLTPGCAVEVNSEYFGSVFKFAAGSSEKVRGTILGSFEIPVSRCNRCLQKDNDDIPSRKFFYSVRVKLNGMEEAVEAHGVPPQHISVPLSNTCLGGASAPDLPKAIVIGGGSFANDHCNENKAPTNTMAPSPSISRMKGKRITPEDLPLANYEQSSFKGNATNGRFQESFNDSFNIMYQHEGNTKAFGNMLSNGNREIYDSEATSSFEGRVSNAVPIASPTGGRRGRSSSRQMARSNSIHRTRSTSRTRIYETAKSRTVRSNRIPKEPPSRRQINDVISKSSSVDSMNDFEEDIDSAAYDEKVSQMIDIDTSEEEKAMEEQLRKQKSSLLRKSPSKRRDSFKRDIKVDISSEEEVEGRQEASTTTPRSRSHRDIAEFVQDDANEEFDELLSVEDYEEEDSDMKRTTVSTPVSSKKKFGKSWSPSVSSFGESMDDLEQKRTSSSSATPPKRRASKGNLASPSQKVQEVAAPTSSKSPVEGCYLLFDPSSGGKLTIQFSKVVVEGAIGFWAPGEGKVLRGFKFKQNQGRSDLMTGIAGKDYKKKYFNGWCQFIKAAKMHNGSVCKWSEHERIENDVYVYYNDCCEVKQIEDGVLFDVSGIDAITCLPKGNSSFNGVKTWEYGSFINRGDAVGCSMAVR
jgi:hypothetical protein